ncbi:MAG: hypothetical protein CM1200mP17_04100 [Woeseia sp.]|nr:MAG: hypothetical protein CM1200mP17_04100 [Woeseia sp.]
MDNIGKYIMDNSEFDTVRSFTLQDDAGEKRSEIRMFQ